MNLFEIAARQKFRFPSTKGDLTVEQLFELPLSSRSSFDLDSVAKELNRKLKEVGEESFVETVSPQHGELQQKFELVKYIISLRLADNAAKLAATKRANEIQQLEALLDRKSAEALAALSPEEIQARLAALRG